MKGFFRAEGPFFSVASRIADMAVLSVMWIAGCIPLVTILTSTASLYQATVKCIRYDRGSAWREFLDAYQKNLKQGIVLTLLYGAAGALLGYGDFWIVYISQDRSGAMFIPAFALFMLTIFWLVHVLWLVPVFSRFSNTLGNILRLNFVVSVRHMLKGMLLLALFGAAVVCVRASLPFVLIFPSLLMLSGSYISEPVLHRYMPEQREDNGDWRYGFK